MKTLKVPKVTKGYRNYNDTRCDRCGVAAVCDNGGVASWLADSGIGLVTAYLKIKSQGIEERLYLCPLCRDEVKEFICCQDDRS